FSTPTSPTQLYHLSLHDALPISASSIPKAASSASRPCSNRSATLAPAGKFCACLVINWARPVSVTTHSMTCAPSLVTKHAQNFRSEEHTSELQSRFDLVCRLLLE